MMSEGATSKRTYPWSTKLKNRQVTLRIMERKDKDAALKFVQSLPEKDLLFLSLDITDQNTLEGWLKSMENNKTLTVIAEIDGNFVGYGSLVYNQLVWTRHMGEIHLLVSPDCRGMGLGKLLVNEVFMLAHDIGLSKMVAHMAADQKGAVQVFEHLGFKPSALLADYVIDKKDRTHDLIVMSYDVSGFSE
jgi:L-amino acid N-acyltransferase YncA